MYVHELAKIKLFDMNTQSYSLKHVNNYCYFLVFFLYVYKCSDFIA